MNYRALHAAWFLALGLSTYGPRLHAAADKQTDPVLQAAASLYEGIRVETLPNGLRVYLKPIPGAPVVTTMVAYRVGSADEDLNHTGLSHYLEHLMFKGTHKIMPGDIDRLTLRNGGANNAYTSEDYTIYHFDFAADRWDAALGIEADRMRNLCIDKKHEFEQEKGAVIEELQRDEDRPWDLELKAIAPLLFGNGPYGHPVIGERQHVRDATAAVIKAHYDKWYHPNNASLIICGGFDPDQAWAKIQQLFGPIPRGELPQRKAVPETLPRKAPLRKEIPSKFEMPRLLMGFNTVRSGDPDYYALELIQTLLSTGKTSRLYQKLVQGEEIASDVDSSNNAGRYPDWFSLQVQLLPGKDRDRAEQLVLAEIQRLRNEPVSDAELKRVKRILLASTVFGREGVHSLADNLARGVTTNDLDFLKNYLPRIAAVTPAQIQAAARKYFAPEQRVVVWSVPPKQARAGTIREGHGTASPVRLPRRLARTDAVPSAATGITEFSLKQAQRVVLPNGLTLLLFEDHRLPIVVAEALVRHTRLLEPADKAGVAALTGYLLDEGTTRIGDREIAALIEEVGGALSFQASGGSVKVLAPDRHLALQVLFKSLGHADFSKEAVARQRERLLSEIDEAQKQPDVKALLLYRSLVYGSHPFARSVLGTRKTVEPLTPEDCAAYYRRVFVPNNTLVAVVGDFDSKKIVEEITQLTADWSKEPVAKPATPAVDKPKEFTQHIVSMPKAAQLHFYMGHPGIRRDDPNYYKLLVMDYVLGTGPGFTDRLSARLRDREGLAYTVSANITSSAGEEPGLFTCYIGTDAKNFARVKEMFLQELNRLRSEQPGYGEVEDAKKYLLGSLPFQFTTGDRIAGQLLNVERFHLGFNYLDNYRRAVGAVTPGDVQTMARKYLDPQHMVLVVAGAVGPNGKPLVQPTPKAAQEKAGK